MTLPEELVIILGATVEKINKFPNDPNVTLLHAVVDNISNKNTPSAIKNGIALSSYCKNIIKNISDKTVAEEVELEALFLFAVCKLDGLGGVKKNVGYAKDIFKLIFNVHPYASYLLGKIYLVGISGINNPQDKVNAAKCFEFGKGHWHPAIQTAAGLCYLDGIGGEVNLKLALCYFIMAARKQYGPAREMIFECLEKGCDLNKTEMNECLAVYRSAAFSKDRISQYILGRLYLNGFKIDGKIVTDFNQAKNWLWMAAKTGCSNSLYLLGICYEYGKGVQVDLKKAMECYYPLYLAGSDAEKASLSKDFHRLAVYFKTGIAADGSKIGINKVVAYRILMMLSQNADADAEYYTGLCYHNGEGVEKNLPTPVELIKKAASKGHLEAEMFLDKYYPENKKRVDEATAAIVSTNSNLSITPILQQNPSASPMEKENDETAIVSINEAANATATATATAITSAATNATATATAAGTAKPTPIASASNQHFSTFRPVNRGPLDSLDASLVDAKTALEMQKTSCDVRYGVSSKPASSSNSKLTSGLSATAASSNFRANSSLAGGFQQFRLSSSAQLAAASQTAANQNSSSTSNRVLNQKDTQHTASGPAK